MTSTTAPVAEGKPYGIDAFFREAKERGITSLDLVAGLRARGDIPPDNSVQKALAAGEHLAKTVEHFLSTLMRVHEVQTLIDEEEHDATTLAAAQRDLCKAEESLADLWTCVKSDIIGFRERAARATESAANTMTLQEVWNAAGGNPGKAPSRQEVLDALKMLDQVCEEAAEGSQHAALEDRQPMTHKEALKTAFLISRQLAGRSVIGSPADAAGGAAASGVPRDRS